MNQCQTCSADTDTYLCWDHTRALHKTLQQIFAMVTDIQVQVTKQAVGERQPGGKSDEPPAVFDVRASEAADLLDETIRAWSGLEIPPGVGTKLARSLLHAYWLTRHVVDLANREDAGQCLEEFQYALQRASRAVDRRVRKIPLGLCECGRSIFAFPSWTHVACDCGETYDVAASREKLKAAGREQFVTIKEAQGLGEFEGKSFRPGTVRMWVSRGRLGVAGKTPEGANLYRFGDLLDLLDENVG